MQRSDIGGDADRSNQELALHIRSMSEYPSKHCHLSFFWFHISVTGDELACGPFYNFARRGTWSRLSLTVVKAYSNSVHPNGGNQPALVRWEMPTSGHMRSFGWKAPPLPENSQPAQSRRQNTAAVSGVNRQTAGANAPEVVEAIELDEAVQMTGPSKNNGSSGRAVSVFVYAVLVQGFTGFSGFMIAYNTPTIGLGCYRVPGV
jgi:hypothetical protein